MGKGERERKNERDDDNDQHTILMSIDISRQKNTIIEKKKIF